MSVSTTERLRHIRDEIEFIIRTCRGSEKVDVLQDETAQRAVIRSLEIIGEAAKALPDSFRDSHPDIEWRKVAAMRDRLIHGYFTVNWDTVWDVVTVHVPRLEATVRSALDEVTDEPT